MPSIAEHQAQQVLLHDLRNSSEPEAQQAAQPLAKLYHDREMGGLSDDSYDSAAGKGKAPTGWLRGSENLEALKAAAPNLKSMTNLELLDLMKPDNSGFRAEIYLPDPAVLGPGYKPTIVYKGSAGEVLTNHGLRDTTKEDFFANNFPQQIGQKTDYYDRAMRLATQMKDRGLDFEFSGHSLGAGMAAAAAAVTNAPATTFNAAALNPATAARFAQENPGVQVYSTDKIVTGYQVAGELVNDGIQNNIDRLDHVRKAQLGAVFKETAHLLREVPEGAQLLKGALSQEGMPAYAQPALNKFVDALATGNIEKIVHDLPLAAGTLQPILTAKTRLDPNDPHSPLMDRAQIMSLQETSNFAGPVMNTLYVAAHGIHIGHQQGEAIAGVGLLARQRIDANGDTVNGLSALGAAVQHQTTNTSGTYAAAGTRYMGDVAAYARTEAAEFIAGGERRQGKVQQYMADSGAEILRNVGLTLPSGIDHWLDRKADALEKTGDQAVLRNNAEAKAALASGQKDTTTIQTTARVVELETVVVSGKLANQQYAALSGVGQTVDKTLDATGAALTHVTDKAPAAGVLVGGIAATALGAGVEFLPSADPLRNIHATYNIAQTYEFTKTLMPSAGEALQRHLMTETVVPSMDALIHKEEAAARALLQQKQIEPTTKTSVESAAPDKRQGSAALQLNDPQHGDFKLFNQTFGLVKEYDAKIGRSSDHLSEQLAAALTVQAKENGMDNVSHFIINNERGRAFVVDTPDIKAEWRLTAYADIAQATQQPVSQSSEKMAQVNQTLAMQINHDNTPHPNRSGPSMS
jgi:hypothetical protein